MLELKGINADAEKEREIEPEDEIYLRVNEDNPASLKVMMKNDGRVVGKAEGKIFVRIRK